METPRQKEGAKPLLRYSLALYLGLVVFAALALLTAREILHEWRQSLDHSRAQVVFEFVQEGTPVRPTDAPGAIAWLDQQVERYATALNSRGVSDRSTFAELTDPGPIPSAFAHLLEAMSYRAEVENGCRPRWIAAQEEEAAGLIFRQPSGLLFRTQRFLTCSQELPAPLESWLVLTRRKEVDTDLTDSSNASNRFLHAVAPYLYSARDRLDQALAEQPLPAIAGDVPPARVRLYALAEDSTFVSLPHTSGEAAEVLNRVREEGKEFRKRPNLPSYVYNEFFFRFGEPWTPAEAVYSGFYLDIAGQGLVATLLVPQEAQGERWVAALDLSMAIDWQDFARQVDAPLVAQIAVLDSTQTQSAGRPWSAFRSALSQADIDSRLEHILDELAVRERRLGQAQRSIPSHQTAVVEGEGAVAAFQVFRDQWLLILFPELTSRFPWLLVILLVLSGSLLIAGFDRTRRQAEVARAKAQRELEERQNLLETMQVPLMVVDPNTDRVIFGNRAAEELGIGQGSCIGDQVGGADPVAIEHYHRMQMASEATRRAYGVPLQIHRDGEEQVRHVMVRSVAVAAPIDSFQADERHRLAMLFVVDPEADLPIYSAQLEADCRDDERRRLSGLLSHGVETLARVLRHRLANRDEEDFERWLAAYLARRLEVCAWLFDHWHDSPAITPETTLGPAQVQTTLKQMARVFEIVRESRDLRTRLGWANGVLSTPGAQPPLKILCDWPEKFLLTCPVRGGVGLFLEEILVNAIAHGLAGSQPLVSIELDPVRRELDCRISNQVAPTARQRSEQDLKPYGGRRIVERLAGLFGWRNLRCEQQDDRFEVLWRIPVSERPQPGVGD